MLEAEMMLTAFQVHKSWLIPAATVLVVTGLADGLTAWFVTRPILWCALIGSSLPLSMAVFVIIPMLRRERQKC
jgi:hypothetical protein